MMPPLRGYALLCFVEEGEREDSIFHPHYINHNRRKIWDLALLLLSLSFTHSQLPREQEMRNRITEINLDLLCLLVILRTINCPWYRAKAFAYLYTCTLAHVNENITLIAAVYIHLCCSFYGSLNTIHPATWHLDFFYFLTRKWFSRASFVDCRTRFILVCFSIIGILINFIDLWTWQLEHKDIELLLQCNFVCFSVFFSAH